MWDRGLNCSEAENYWKPRGLTQTGNLLFPLFAKREVLGIKKSPGKQRKLLSN